MYNKVKNIIYLTILSLFFILTILFYFSEENKQKIYKNRNDISSNIKKNHTDIPLLKNDTVDIIDYNSSNIHKDKIKKRFFWELLKKDKNG